MIIDLEDRPTESGTFDLKGGGKVSIRLLSSKEVEDIRKATFTTVNEYPLLKDPKTGEEAYRRFSIPKFNGDLWDELWWDAAIKGWEGLFDKNKKPVPVTKEMKVLLMSEKVPATKDTPAVPKFPDFYNAVIEGLKILGDREKEKAEAAPKN